MALKNNYLTKARKDKNDEFYTLYEDIEREVFKFADNFKNKIVYCPCDNKNSKFPTFFQNNFKKLGLKGLYCSANDGKTFYYDDVIGKRDYNKIPYNKVDITTKRFEEILDLCDIVVTNPPFSVFIQFIDTIINHNKEFLIIGQQNTISCRDIFSHIMDGKINLHYGFPGIAGYFRTTKGKQKQGYVDNATAGEHIDGCIRVSGVIWYTSFDLSNENPPLNLTATYYGNENKYPKYINFRAISGLDEDAINVDKVKDIPNDYYGIMGVPISFFGKYSPKQFELIQLDHYGPLGNLDNKIMVTVEKETENNADDTTEKPKEYVDIVKQTYRRIYVRLKKK